MDYKKILGVKNLFVSDDGFMYTLNSLGEYKKLKRYFKQGYLHSSYNSTEYKLSNIVYRYFVEDFDDTIDSVYSIKGKDPKLDNLFLDTKPQNKIKKDVVGEITKSGWKIIDVKRKGSNRKVKIECPCGEFKKEVTYTNARIATFSKCICDKKNIITRKIDNKTAKKILKDREKGMLIKDITKKYNITDTTFYNIKNNRYNYDKK